MCLFCGGICGGAGDMLLPALVTGAGLIVLKIKASRDPKREELPGQDEELKSRVNTSKSEEAQ